MPELGRYEDDRGVIQDLFGPVDSVTQIYTCRGAVRGNHYHAATTQWAYVVSGKLLVATYEDDGPHEKTFGPGEISHEPPGVHHAWKALEDTVVLVFTRGPRSGEAYETDTHRLEVPILT
jgi:quercetin dioxygenase-like cupin family protein